MITCPSGYVSLNATVSTNSDFFMALMDMSGMTSPNGYVEVQYGFSSNVNSVKRLVKVVMKRQDAIDSDGNGDGHVDYIDYDNPSRSSGLQVYEQLFAKRQATMVTANVALVYTNGTVYEYVNGVLVTTYKTSGTFVPAMIVPASFNSKTTMTNVVIGCKC